MSNIEKLQRANLLDLTKMTADQVAFINNHLTADETQALISVGARLHGSPGASRKQPRVVL